MTAPRPETLECERESEQAIPAWVDKARLCREICACDATVDLWVRTGVLPPGKKRGGKLMWKWATVDDWLENGNPNGHASQDNDPSSDRAARMREAMQGASRR